MRKNSKKNNPLFENKTYHECPGRIVDSPHALNFVLVPCLWVRLLSISFYQVARFPGFD